MWARRPGPARPRAIVWLGAGVFAPQSRKPAGEGLTHVPHHLEAAWHVVEALGHVGADPAQNAAAVRAAADAGINNLLARQVVGERPSCGLGGLFAGCPEHLGNSREGSNPLCMILIERLNRQFELLDGALDLLRRAAKLRPLEPGKLEPKLLDLGTRRNRILHQLADNALERIDVIRQRGRIDRHEAAFPPRAKASDNLGRPFLLAGVPRPRRGHAKRPVTDQPRRCP